MIRLKSVVGLPGYHSTLNARAIRGDRLYGFDAKSKEPLMYNVNSGLVSGVIDADFEDCYSDRELWIMRSEQMAELSARKFKDHPSWRRMDLTFPFIGDREIHTRGLHDNERQGLTSAAEWLLAEATACRLDVKKLNQGFRSFGFSLPKDTLARHGAGFSFGAYILEDVLKWTLTTG